MTDQQQDALKNYLTCLADDEFILGHRMSEWTGLGPIIEEDIAFSSMAQDELGHALGFYTLLEELGAPDADTMIYTRPASGYRNSIFTELPRGDYGFSLMRQFLYDAAESARLTSLQDSTEEPLRNLARRMMQEERYHWVHGTSMIKRLCGGTDEARARMQEALDAAFPGQEFIGGLNQAWNQFWFAFFIEICYQIDDHLAEIIVTTDHFVHKEQL